MFHNPKTTHFKESGAEKSEWKSNLVNQFFACIFRLPRRRTAVGREREAGGRPERDAAAAGPPSPPRRTTPRGPHLGPSRSRRPPPCVMGRRRSPGRRRKCELDDGNGAQPRSAWVRHPNAQHATDGGSPLLTTTRPTAGPLFSPLATELFCFVLVVL